MTSPSRWTEAKEPIPLILTGSAIFTLVWAAMIPGWGYKHGLRHNTSVRAVTAVGVLSVFASALRFTGVRGTSVYNIVNVNRQLYIE